MVSLRTETDAKVASFFGWRVSYRCSMGRVEGVCLGAARHKISSQDIVAFDCSLVVGGVSCLDHL